MAEVLKMVLKTLDGLPKEIAEKYEEKSGEFHLQVEGAVPKSKVDEFRTNNIELNKALEDLKKKFDGVDPEEYKKIKDDMVKMQDKKLLDAGKVDELLTQKTERMKQDYDARIDALSKENENLKGQISNSKKQLSSILIDTEITKAVTKVGQMKQGAMQDILNRGRSVWQLEEGVPIPKKDDKLLYSKDGQHLMTFDEWAEMLTKEAPYLFEASAGGGAPGSDGKKFAGNVDLSKLGAAEKLKYIHRNQAAAKK